MKKVSYEKQLEDALLVMTECAFCAGSGIGADQGDDYGACDYCRGNGVLGDPWVRRLVSKIKEERRGES